MTSSTSPRPSSRLVKTLIGGLLATLVLTLAPLPAQAYYDEATQLPGTVQRRSEGGSSGSGGGHRCGSPSDPFAPGPVLWRREADNRWRVEIINYPGCTGSLTAVVDTRTNETDDIDISDTWGNAGNSLYCLKYAEVLRFYGPRSDPARHVTRSIATPRVPCADTDGFDAARALFGFFSPHPHDSNNNPNSPLYRNTGIYTTTAPLSTAWQPQGSNSSGHHCPLPEDRGNLRRFFGTTWSTEEEAALAQGFRQGMSTAFSNLLSITRRAGHPDSTALSILNSNGTRRYSGDSFTSLNYPDNVPCSSPLDFTVPDGSEPWVYGVCAAPVVTSYRGPFWVRVGGNVYRNVVESYPDSWDTSPTRNGYRRHLPDYPADSPGAYLGNFNGAPVDNVIRAYRTRAASVLGRTDQFQYRFSPNVVGRATEMAANLPCYYGIAPVEPEATIIEDREPVDPVAISGPDYALAYVGGLRTAQSFVFTPNTNLTCNGGQECTQGQVIESVSYSPQISVPSGWTSCTSSNRGTCDYRMSWSQAGTTLTVNLETYTATRPGESITVTPSGRVRVRWPQLETDSGELSFTVTIRTTGSQQSGNLMNTVVRIPYGPGSSSAVAEVTSVPLPASIEVAGSRTNTHGDPSRSPQGPIGNPGGTGGVRIPRDPNTR